MSPLEPSTASAGSDPSPTRESHGPVLPAARFAAAVCLVEAIALGVTVARYVSELSSGTAADASMATMSMIVTIIFTLLLLVLAAHWWRGRRWPRTPTIVWNLLLLPAAWTLAQTNGPLVGGLVALVAIAGVVAAWLSPPADLPEDRAL